MSTINLLARNCTLFTTSAPRSVTTRPKNSRRWSGPRWQSGRRSSRRRGFW